MFNSSAVVLGIVGAIGAIAQPPPAILTIDLANLVEYYQDTSDLSKLGSNPSVTPPAIGTAQSFFPIEVVADIVSVNGQPVKGLYISQNRLINASATPTAGQMIADMTVTGHRQDIFKILATDGSVIGTITATGFSGGTPSPGGASTQKGGDWAITGGTGAFLGVRGQMGGTATPKSAERRP
jgi:hypothetical protein